MRDSAHDRLYQAFGRAVRMRRETRDGMTQEKLGHAVGLSRTSITNIERGRQHVSLHQLFALADALKVQVTELMPSMSHVLTETVELERLPRGTESDIVDWAKKVTRK